MRSNTWRVVMLFSLTLVLMSAAMDAQAARRSSLAGNQFINDADDMFAFPQLSMKYKNRAVFDFAPGGDEGSGSITFGNNWAWQFTTGKGGYQNTASWVWGAGDRNPAGFGNPDYEWWDVGVATHIGDTPFGFKFNWAKDSNKDTDPGDTDPNADNSENLMSFQVGTTLGSVELAAELGFGSYTDKIAPPAPIPSDVNDHSTFVFTLLGRGDLEFSDINWRYVGAFSSGSMDPKAENVPSYSVTAFRGSFGPVWGTPGEWEVAAYMSFEYAKEEGPLMDDTDPQNPVPVGNDKKVSDTTTNFPSYNMAMEYYLNSWLVIRGGVKSMAGSLSAEEDDVTSDNTGKEDSRDFDFNWSLGLGVDKGNWGLDLALEEDNVHSGYVVLNGDQMGDEHPIAYMSAWLAW